MSIKALSGKVFMLITGASRGIGRQLAILLGSILEDGSCVLLLAKNINALQETAKMIPTNISVVTTSVDLSKASKDELHSMYLYIYMNVNTHKISYDYMFIESLFFIYVILGIIMQSLKNKTPEEFDRVVILHNAGTMGNITECANDMTDINTWRSYYDLNVFSPIILNGVVMKIFNEDTNTEKTIINITSLFAIQPGKAVCYYATGKAAREMFFKVTILC